MSSPPDIGAVGTSFPDLSDSDEQFQKDVFGDASAEDFPIEMRRRAVELFKRNGGPAVNGLAKRRKEAAAVNETAARDAPAAAVAPGQS